MGYLTFGWLGGVSTHVLENVERELAAARKWSVSAVAWQMQAQMQTDLAWPGESTAYTKEPAAPSAGRQHDAPETP